MSNDNYTGRNLYRVEVEAKKVNELLDRLNDDEAKKAIKSALRRSILIIRKQAQEKFSFCCYRRGVFEYKEWIDIQAVKE